MDEGHIQMSFESRASRAEPNRKLPSTAFASRPPGNLVLAPGFVVVVGLRPLAAAATALRRKSLGKPMAGPAVAR